jgi:hypothetical protein
MSQFKIIEYGKLLYETLRSNLSVTKVYTDDTGTHGGLLSIIYRYCLSMVIYLQSYLDSFHIWRGNKWLISQCKFEIGQLTNMLRYMFDPTNNLYISQTLVANVFVPSIVYYESSVLVPSLITSESSVLAPSITSQYTIRSLITFHVPLDYSIIGSVKYNELVSVIEQVKFSGINYNIVSL